MTLQEAIKSGKRFRRRDFFRDGYTPWYTAISAENMAFRVAEIMADWETEEKSVLVTKSQLVEAWAAVNKPEQYRYLPYEFAKLLGLE